VNVTAIPLVTAGLVTTGLVAAEKEGEAIVSPGLAGFVVTFLLALATLFLIRSMVKHLRKVRYGPQPEDLERTAVPRAPEGSDHRSGGAGEGPDAA
jgi:hypothetical protein